MMPVGNGWVELTSVQSPQLRNSFLFTSPDCVSKGMGAAPGGQAKDLCTDGCWVLGSHGSQDSWSSNGLG